MTNMQISPYWWPTGSQVWETCEGSVVVSNKEGVPRQRPACWGPWPLAACRRRLPCCQCPACCSLLHSFRSGRCLTTTPSPSAGCLLMGQRHMGGKREERESMGYLTKWRRERDMTAYNNLKITISIVLDVLYSAYSCCCCCCFSAPSHVKVS